MLDAFNVAAGRFGRLVRLVSSPKTDFYIVHYRNRRHKACPSPAVLPHALGHMPKASRNAVYIDLKGSQLFFCRSIILQISLQL